MDQILMNLLVVGQIPGTETEISFDTFILTLLTVAITYLVSMLAMDTLEKQLARARSWVAISALGTV